MSTLKDYLREVRDAAVEHLEARHGDNAGSATHPLPREEALTTLALVTIRLLEQQLQTRDMRNQEELEGLQSHLKACRKALKSHTAHAAGAGGAAVGGAPALKRSRGESAEGVKATASPSAPAGGVGAAEKAKKVELGQYSSSDAFGHDEEKRMKFARLMGGAKAAASGSAVGGSSGGAQHNTLAKSSAEVRRMNENLESQFDFAMNHKGKKGLGA